MKNRSAVKKAVVLLSGGLDSLVALYQAKSEGFTCYPLVFDYGQRHRREIERAKIIAKKAKCKLRIVKIRLPWKGSSLLDKKQRLPVSGNRAETAIPSTYVPGRNIIFLSFALSYAETIDARAIFIGAHAQDYSGYPDCRPEFYTAFQRVVYTGTKAGVEGARIKIITPLIHKDKAQIIRMGARLGAPLGVSWSCYKGGKIPCGKCESCFYRAKGFKEAGVTE